MSAALTLIGTLCVLQEDTAAFIRWYNATHLPAGAENARWLVVGGSYPGKMPCDIADTSAARAAHCHDVLVS